MSALSVLRIEEGLADRVVAVEGSWLRGATSSEADISIFVRSWGGVGSFAPESILKPGVCQFRRSIVAPLFLLFVHGRRPFICPFYLIVGSSIAT